jgi:hypothetical protein
MISNCHVHNKIEVPKYFAGKLTPLLQSNFMIKFYGLFDNPFVDNDIIDRLQVFLKASKLTEKQHLDLMLRSHRLGGEFIVNTVDLSCMGAGKVKKNFIKQVAEFLELVKDRDSIRVLLMVDPRVPYINELYNLYASRINEFAGIKIYPNIGYSITDTRLKRFFDVSENKVVTVHCTDSTPVFYKGDDLQRLLEPIKHYHFYKDSKNRRELCANFAYPHLTMIVAQQYPKINFNLAHFGGNNKEWIRCIIKGANNLNNVYYDISSTYKTKEDYQSLIITDKTLYGNDWDMSLLNKSEDIENCLGIVKLRKLENNYKNFLKLQ